MLHSLSTIVSAMNDVADIVRNDNYNVIVNKWVTSECASDQFDEVVEVKF